MRLLQALENPLFASRLKYGEREPAVLIGTGRHHSPRFQGIEIGVGFVALDPSLAVDVAFIENRLAFRRACGEGRGREPAESQTDSAKAEAANKNCFMYMSVLRLEVVCRPANAGCVRMQPIRCSRDHSTKTAR